MASGLKAAKADPTVLESRPIMAIFAPSSLKSWAVARPMPLLPHVMTAIFPSSFLDDMDSPFLLGMNGLHHGNNRAGMQGCGKLKRDLFLFISTERDMI